MKLMLVLVIILGSLFALAYGTKRRFGILGLALCAGSILSATWTASLTPFLEDQGIRFSSPPLASVVTTLLILLPAMLLLFTGPIHKNTLARLLGSLGFTFLAFMLLLHPLGEYLVGSGLSLKLYQTLSNISNAVVIIGILIALADVLISHRNNKKHKKPA